MSPYIYGKHAIPYLFVRSKLTAISLRTDTLLGEATDSTNNRNIIIKKIIAFNIEKSFNIRYGQMNI